MAAGTQAQAAQVHTARARNVWTVLAFSMVLFLTLCGSTGFAAYSYLSNVQRLEHGSLQLVHGTQLNVVRHNRVEIESVPKATTLNEGDEVRLGPDTEANIDLFDGSTIHLYFNARVTLSALRSSRFFGNRKDIEINVAVDPAASSSTVVFSTAGIEGYTSAVYRVLTPDSEITGEPGSTLRVQLASSGTDTGTTAVLTGGSATVLALGKSVELSPGMMTTVATNSTPQDSQPAEQELIANGDFSQTPTSRAEMAENGGMDTAAWLPIHEQVAGGDSDTGSVQVQTENLFHQSVRAAVIDRPAGGDRYGKVGFRQEINAPASFLHYIKLDATVKLVAQTEPVGGPQGDVFPLTIRVLYTDPNGRQQEWKHSFYYCTSGAGNCNMKNADAVPLGSYTRPKSFFLKGSSTGEARPEDESAGGQDIATINAIEIFGIGNRFQSWISDISLTAR